MPVRILKAAIVLIIVELLCGTQGAANLTSYKQHYKIAGLALKGLEDEMTSLFGPTFETFLNREVSSRFNPAITFEFIPMNYSHIRDAVKEEKIDFVFTNPSLFSCIESTYETSAIATIRNFRLGKELSEYGGVIFTSNSNVHINELEDLKNKIVEGESFTSLSAMKMQWQTLFFENMSLMNDPAQIRFSHDPNQTVTDVLTGVVDAGFVRTDYLERLNQSGHIDFHTDIKIIHHVNASVDHHDFPFEVSTNLFPEWPLGVLKHVDWHVSQQVSEALMTITVDMNESISGHYATWQAPHSYMKLRDMQEELQWITFDKALHKYKCKGESGILYDNIVCPTGWVKRTHDDEARQCDLLVQSNGTRFQCPNDNHTECLCHPCKFADDVETSCSRMKSCVSAEQLAPIRIHAYDHFERAVGNMSYIFHADAHHLENVEVGYAIRNGSRYYIDLSSANRGSHILEIFFNGEQVPSSPTIIKIIEKTCPQHFKADDHGICVDSRAPVIEARANGYLCSKMHECLTVEQLEIINFHVMDHLTSYGNLTYKLHDTSAGLKAHIEVAQQHLWNYSFSIQTAATGVHVLEILMDGDQIDDSPTLLKVVAKDCGTDALANAQGQCIAMVTAADDDKSVYFYTVFGILPLLAVVFYILIKRKGQEFAEVFATLFEEAFSISSRLLIHFIDLATDVYSYVFVLQTPELSEFVIPYTVFLLLGGLSSLTEIWLGMVSLRALLCKDMSKIEREVSEMAHLEESKMYLATGSVIDIKNSKALQVELNKANHGVMVNMISIGTTLLEDIPFMIINALIIIKLGEVDPILIVSMLVNCFIAGTVTATYKTLRINIEIRKRFNHLIFKGRSRRQSKVEGISPGAESKFKQSLRVSRIQSRADSEVAAARVLPSVRSPQATANQGTVLTPKANERKTTSLSIRVDSSGTQPSSIRSPKSPDNLLTKPNKESAKSQLARKLVQANKRYHMTFDSQSNSVGIQGDTSEAPEPPVMKI